MKARILKCSDEQHWYKNNINQVFDGQYETLYQKIVGEEKIAFVVFTTMYDGNKHCIDTKDIILLADERIKKMNSL